MRGHVDTDRYFDFKSTEHNTFDTNQTIVSKRLGPAHLSIILNKPDILLLLLNGGSASDLTLDELQIISKSKPFEAYQHITPLHLSLLSQSWKCVDILLCRGVNFNLRTGKIRLRNRSLCGRSFDLDQATALHCLAVSQNPVLISEYLSKDEFRKLLPSSCLFNWEGETPQNLTVPEFCSKLHINIGQNP